MHDGGMADIEVLNGPRLRLRAPTRDDAKPLFERVASDPEVAHYTPLPNVGEEPQHCLLFAEAVR